MKNIKSLFWALITSLFSYQSFAQCNSELVLYLTMNGNAYDYSLNGNNGTVNGAQPTTDRFGELNNAYYFDGVDDDIVIADNSSLDLEEEWTISVWVKPDSGYGSFFVNHLSIVDKWGEGGVGNAAYTLGVYTGGFMEGLTYNGEAGTYTHSNSVIPVNEWSHLVVTRNSDSLLSYYINGELDKEIEGSHIPQNSSFPLTIGMAASPTVNFNTPDKFRFKGVIDDIKISKCSTSSADFEPIGISEYKDKSNFQILENPLNNTLIILGVENEVLDIVITDYLGKEILKRPYSSKGIDVSALNQGFYFVSIIENGNSIETKKVIKQ